MKYRSFVLILALVVSVSACGDGISIDPTPADTLATTGTTSADAVVAASPGMGQGGNSSMMERHRATIPAEYAGLTNPIQADEESLARGAEAYATCAVCHGDGGLGDGTAAAGFDPVPANIAHTSQMMGDDYLFWRITEGGAQFETAMPAWGLALDEQVRWDLINYIQALGAGTPTPGRGMGGGRGFDPEVQAAQQAAQQAALLVVAVDQGIITQEESDVFADAHVMVDARMAEVRGTTSGGGADTMLPTVLADLVASGDLTQGDADVFVSVHDRLAEAGLLR